MVSLEALFFPTFLLTINVYCASFLVYGHVDIGFTAMNVATRKRAFSFTGFHSSVVNSKGRGNNTLADILNRSNLGMDVMHARKPNNCAVNLASEGSFFFTLKVSVAVI